MSRLIVVSNRVNPPPSPEKGDGEGSVGGLAMALAAALREYSGIWFGWSGKTTPQFTGQLAMQRVDGVTTATVDLEEGDYQEYYNGYANKTLWPLFHYRVDLTAYDRSFGEGYDRVNKRFAETLRPLIEPDDIIWVHDYHLIPMARELRRMGVTNRIGFFLHIPWPAHQLVVTLPRHRPLVEAMFDYDLIGFQTEESRHAFEGYVTSEVGGSVAANGDLTAFGKTTRAAAFPIGIDAEDFARITQSPRARKVYDRMLAHSVFRKMVVGVDRLDYSKGLEERLIGFERFLHDNPDMRREVMLLQIAPLSRDEVVHGKGSLISKMSGGYWQKFANLRALYGFMWGHPGKKLLFMGGEFAQWNEWNDEASLDWNLLDFPQHDGVRRLIRDLNQIYRRTPALHEIDFDPSGFEWISANDSDNSVLAFLRRAHDRSRVMLCVCNFTPVVRHSYRLGAPGPGVYHERLNTDSEYYGGSNIGNTYGMVDAEPIAAHGREWSLSLTLPPLATVFLEWEH